MKVSQQRKEAVGHSHGKIILMGEHSVVYGEPAIALPFSAVDITAHVWEEGNALRVTCAFYDGLVHQMPKVWESLKHAIRFSLYRVGAPTDPGIHIEISSTIPAERGMGSSAAVAVAIARAVFAYYGKPLSAKDLWDIVQTSEKIAHGNPSGVDAATTSGHRPVYFVKGAPIESLSIQMKGFLVVADSGQTGNTLEAVSDVAHLLEHSPAYKIWIDRLGEATRLAKEAILNKDLVLLGQQMTTAHHDLQALGVSEAKLDHLVEAALTAGALGAKLTGGGRGGCMIALVETKEAAVSLTQALHSAGAHQTWIQDLGEYDEV